MSTKPNNTKLLLSILDRYLLFANHKIQELTLLPNQGQYNQNYIMHTNNGKYIVRVHADANIDRSQEQKIHLLAYQNSISSEPLLLDVVNSIMITTYIKGQHHTELTIEKLKNLANTLKTLHSIKIDIDPIILSVDTSLVEKFSHDLVLCHNDLNPKNLIWNNNSLTLIDWEYAGINDRYFDLACVLIEFRLNDAHSDTFLKSYFGKSSKINIPKLHAYMKLYQSVCKLWHKSAKIVPIKTKKA